MTFKNSTRIALVAIPATLVAVFAAKLADAAEVISGKLVSASDKVRAYSLRKAAATLDGQAKADENTAIELSLKLNKLRDEANELYCRSLWSTRSARQLRKEADDIDPPAPVLAEPEEVSEE